MKTTELITRFLKSCIIEEKSKTKNNLDNLDNIDILQTTKKSKSAGVAFAANKDLTVGIAHGRTDSGIGTSPLDEKITVISVGYSLGPVGLGVAVGKVDNYSHTAVDGKTALFTATTKF